MGNEKISNSFAVFVKMLLFAIMDHLYPSEVLWKIKI